MLELLLVHSCLVMSVSSFLIMLSLQPPLLPANVASDHASRSRGGCSASSRAVDGVAEVLRRHCERCAASSWPDVVAAVTASLRLDADDHDDERCGGCAAMAAAEDLLERKEATERELREAFHVLDRDDDGFVGAGDLCNVLRSLGIGMLMPGTQGEGEGEGEEECCARMIAAHDGDGDGRISFREFRAMMEHAV